jgi:pimeloyl-ACP methyl ester carboxylesterase
MGPNSKAILDNALLFDHWFMLLKHFNTRSQMVHGRRKFEVEEIAGMRDRALFLIGEHDRLANNSESIRALDDLAMRYMIVKDAGHTLNHEQAEEVNGEIVRFLKSAVQGKR